MLQSTQRKYQLTFCLICSNSKFDRNEGVICGLSSQKAKFLRFCNDYQISNLKYSNLVSDLNRKVILKDNKSEIYIIPSSKMNSKFPLIFKDNAKIIVKPNKYIWLYSLISAIISGIAAFSMESGNKNFDKLLILTIGCIIISITSLIYKKPIFTIKNETIKLYNNEFLLNDLVLVGKREWIDINLKIQREYFFGTKTNGLITSNVKYPIEYLIEKIKNSTHNNS